MQTSIKEIAGQMIRVISCDAAVVGTGAAGYAAAMYLREQGVEDTVIVTENVTYGTSRNTGSDKQTYYKLSLAGDCADSPAAMARDLFAGGAVDGDVAMAEAANSVTCFLRLAHLGVAFPVNRYGEYIGYKTDHDPRARATSAGPLTSRFMTEALQSACEGKHIPVLDRMQVIEILRDGDMGGVSGLLLLDKSNAEEPSYAILECGNIVWATGGPAGIYHDSVYPACHTGGSGVLFAGGVIAQNMTEWQFGLASIAPRWNVSGTYMQVLPRFVSVDAAGEEHYFLEEFFSPKECLTRTFLKGYEWPFDSRRVQTSSSIDLLVAREIGMGRRVYLDYRVNPYGGIDYTCLREDARRYLEQAGACFGTPLDRLKHMNPPAYELYLGKGVDLAQKRLEIALCAQHCNGGAAVDMWWQSSLKGLFVVGEAAGTHGVYRPGGSALNAGQVGALRAARYISAHMRRCDSEVVLATAETAVKRHLQLRASVLGVQSNVAKYNEALRAAMSGIAGPIRIYGSICRELADTEELLSGFGECVKIKHPAELPSLYKLMDNLVCRAIVLRAQKDFYEVTGGRTRGSALYVNETGEAPAGIDSMPYLPDAGKTDMVQEVSLAGNVTWRPVRDLPEGGGFFENVWRGYRENGNIY